MDKTIVVSRVALFNLNTTAAKALYRLEDLGSVVYQVRVSKEEMLRRYPLYSQDGRR